MKLLQMRRVCFLSAHQINCNARAKLSGELRLEKKILFLQEIMLDLAGTDYHRVRGGS
jgi:hypothetical protein